MRKNAAPAIESGAHRPEDERRDVLMTAESNVEHALQQMGLVFEQPQPVNPMEQQVNPGVVMQNAVQLQPQVGETNGFTLAA